MLRLEDQWIWDSWVADDGDRYHLFFFQAPRALGDPGKRLGDRWVLVFSCHSQEMTPERIAKSGEYCTWSVPSPGPLGPFEISAARPFTAEPDLFAAPLVQLRDGTWAIIGFRNLEPKGLDGFHIIDPVPVELDPDGYLVAGPVAAHEEPTQG